MSIEEAYNNRKNLTLMQILGIMNLHAMPGMAVNVIHDKIQTRFKRMMVKIKHDSRVFACSCYYWHDLKQIESIINSMFEYK